MNRLGIVVGFALLTACGSPQVEDVPTTFMAGDEDRFFNEAVELRNAGDLQGSEAALQQALQANPRYLAAMLALGDLQLEREHFVEAEQTFTDAVTLRDRTPDAHLGLARATFAQQRHAEAAAHAQRAIETAIASGSTILHGEALVTRAEIEMAMNQLDQAAGSLDEALEVDSTNTRARVARARLTAQQGDTRAAVQMLARAETFETDTELLRDIGILYYDMRIDDRAIEALDRATQLGSMEETVTYHLAAAHMRIGHRDVGIELASDLLRRNPDHLGARVVRGRGELQRNYIDRARTDVSFVLAANPLHYDALMLEGDLFNSTGNAAEAELSYTEAFGVDGTRPDAAIALAELYFGQARYAEFIEVVAPRSDAGWAPAEWPLRLSDAYLAEGDFENAILLKSAIALEERSNVELNFATARLAMEHPGILDISVVTQHASYAYQSSNRSVDYLLMMVDVYLAAGNCVQARNHMETASRGYPTLAQVRERESRVRACD